MSTFVLDMSTFGLVFMMVTVADLTGRKLKWRQNGICMTRQVACRGVKVI